jgi:hypothetical protein
LAAALLLVALALAVLDRGRARVAA